MSTLSSCGLLITFCKRIFERNRSRKVSTEKTVNKDTKCFDLRVDRLKFRLLLAPATLFRYSKVRLTYRGESNLTWEMLFFCLSAVQKQLSQRDLSQVKYLKRTCRQATTKMSGGCLFVERDDKIYFVTRGWC